MAEREGTVRVVVRLTHAQASVLARAAVVVTSALDCKEVNAADQGLREFRSATALALLQDIVPKAVGRLDSPSRSVRRAS